MLDIGWQEIFIIAVVVIVVVGPKDLPHVLSNIVKWVRKARGMAREFQSGIDDMIRDAELQDVQKQLEDSSDFDVASEIENAIDPNGELKNDLDMKAVESGLDDAAAAALAEDHAEREKASDPEEEKTAAPSDVDSEETEPPAPADAESDVPPKRGDETSEKTVG